MLNKVFIPYVFLACRTQHNICDKKEKKFEAMKGKKIKGSYYRVLLARMNM